MSLNLPKANGILIIAFFVTLASYVFFNRAMGLDGSHNLLRMLLDNSFYFLEQARSSFYILQQMPALIFIKNPNFDSSALLVKIFSFGLVWIHIISFFISYLILPREKKHYIFFPLLGFLTGPLTAFSLSVSSSLSVFSYVWLVAFVIHYSDLSSIKHKLFFFLLPIPLIFSHEMMSYMAWPLIYLALLKLKKIKNSLMSKIITKIIISYLFIISISSIFFILFPVESEIKNRTEFFNTLILLEFFLKIERGSIEWIYPPCIIAFFLLIMPFGHFLKRNFKQIFVIICLFLIALFGVTALILSFQELFFVFKLTNEEEARVWVVCMALPLSLLIWWFFENNKLQLERSFFIAFFLTIVSLLSWRVGSDYQFYQYQRKLSQKLLKCRGLLNWSEVSKKNINKSSSIAHPFHLTAYSLFLQNRKDISSLLTSSKQSYLEIENCFNNGRFCEKIKTSHCYYKETYTSMCNYFNLETINQSRFFNLNSLLQTVSKSKSYCEGV